MMDRVYLFFAIAWRHDKGKTENILEQKQAIYHQNYFSVLEHSVRFPHNFENLLAKKQVTWLSVAKNR